MERKRKKEKRNKIKDNTLCSTLNEMLYKWLFEKLKINIKLMIIMRVGIAKHLIKYDFMRFYQN